MYSRVSFFVCFEAEYHFFYLLGWCTHSVSGIQDLRSSVVVSMKKRVKQSLFNSPFMHGGLLCPGGHTVLIRPRSATGTLLHTRVEWAAFRRPRVAFWEGGMQERAPVGCIALARSLRVAIFFLEIF